MGLLAGALTRDPFDMGLGDRWKAVRAVAEYAAASSEHWAMVVHVGHRAGPLIALELEIHNGVRPPFRVSTMSWVPPGVRPVIGRHVAFHIPPGDNRHTHYAVDWTKPPRYGTAAEQQSLAQEVVKGTRKSGEEPATANERERKVREILDRMGRQPRPLR